jgi:EAL domain-containing protein (putative c-di-GMP-specific phosphodiesterase class I)
MSEQPSTAFSDLLDRRYLHPEYQAIFDLASDEMIGAEALARWIDLDISPESAFVWASREGRLAELDEACRDAAIDDAVAHGLPRRFTLFVNLEPSVLGPGTASRLLARTAGTVDLVVEITERALLHRPAELLAACHELREAGCAIALDDVGAIPATLALLPFVAPDVIKLDVALVQGWPNVSRSVIYTTVAAYAERTGATILAEGIESPAHLDQALALGATLGQGFHLQRPGRLGTLEPPSRSLSRRQPVAASPTSAFSLVNPSLVRIAGKRILEGISEHLEYEALSLNTPPVVLGSFEEGCHFTAGPAARYAHLATRCPVVAALGADMASAPARGVRGVPLAPDDPLRREWVVAVVGAHYAGALIAQDLGDGGPDRLRRFAYVLTHDYDTVLAAARSLLARVTYASGYPGLAPVASHWATRQVDAA